MSSTKNVRIPFQGSGSGSGSDSDSDSDGTGLGPHLKTWEFRGPNLNSGTSYTTKHHTNRWTLHITHTLSNWHVYTWEKLCKE